MAMGLHDSSALLASAPASLLILLVTVLLVPEHHLRMVMNMCRPDISKRYLLHCHQHALLHPASLQLEARYFANSGYTDVWRGTHGARTVAVKVWRGASLTNAARCEFSSRLGRELDKWARAKQHPHIVPFFGVVSGLGHLPALVLPYYKNGNAMEYLLKHPETDVLHLLLGLASALEHLHAQDPPIAHGTVKCSNIMISDTGEALLSDTGVSTIPYPPDWTLSNMDNCRWTAPELLAADPDVDPDGCAADGADACRATPAGDVYGFAMAALEMYTRAPPFAHRRFFGGVVFDVVLRRARPARPRAAALDDGVWGVLTACWAHAPAARPAAGAAGAWLQLLAQMRAAGVAGESGWPAAEP